LLNQDSEDKAMSLEETTLLAYVDGELPPAQRAEVEQALAADPALARTLQALRVSQLPYARAFEQQNLPPLPEALRAQAQQWAAQAVPQAAAPAVVALQLAAVKGSQPAGGGGVAWRGWLCALALALAAGWWGGSRSGAAGQPVVEPWVRMVSSYHLMYSRETVLDGGVGLAQVNALKARLRDQHQLELKIPDLQSQGLQFVRAQQLQLDGKMVLQLVYLPANGLPVALCLTPASAQVERSVSLDGQAVTTWFDGGWAYLLVGRLPAPALQQLRGAIKSPVV
jgi:anti-sigma factor RsiW